MSSPWDVVSKAVTRLSDRVNAIPGFREATVSSIAPLQVKFDTDNFSVAVSGSLTDRVTPGSRVLTVQVGRYVWILGVKRGSVGGGGVCLAVKNTTTTIPANGEAVISGVTSVTGAGIDVSYTTGTFTIITPGWYSVTFNAKFSSMDPAGRRGIFIRYSTGDILDVGAGGQFSDTLSLSVHDEVLLKAGDVVTFVAVGDVSQPTTVSVAKYSIRRIQG